MSIVDLHFGETHERLMRGKGEALKRLQERLRRGSGETQERLVDAGEMLLKLSQAIMSIL